jgi:hypothetical protein
VSQDAVSAVGTAVAADAPPASDKDMPTAPTTGTASFRRFRFEACFVCDIVELPMPSMSVALIVNFAQTNTRWGAASPRKRALGRRSRRMIGRQCSATGEP